ncbi:hypothetical protein Ancab_036051 [Ancistrocladus abbreviatus]
MTNAGDKCLAGKTLTADALVLKGQPEMEQAIVGTKPLKRKRKRSKKNKADSVTNCNPGYFALCETPNMRQGSSLKGAVDSCIQVDGEVPSCGTGGSLSLEKKLGDIKSFNLDRKQGDKRVLDHLDVVEHSNHASEIAKLDPVGRSSEICVVLHSINKVERKGKRKRKRSNKNKADVVTNCNPGDFALRETANMRQGLSLKDAVDSCIQMDEEVPSCGTGGSLSLEKKLGDLKSFNLDGKQGDKRVLDHLDVMEHSNHASEIAKLDAVGRSSEICVGLHGINKEERKGKRKRKRLKKNKADSATNCNPGDIALRETTYMERGLCLKDAVNSCIQMEEEVPPCGTGVTKRIVGHLDVMEHSDHASEIAKLDPVGRSSEICVGLHSINKVERKRKRKRKRSKKNKADSVTNCNPGYFALRESPNMRQGSSLKDAVDSCIQVDGEVPSCGTEGSLSLEKKLGDIKSFDLDRKQGDKRVLDHLDVMEHSNHASEIAKLDPVGRSSEICAGLHSINKEEGKGKRKRKRSKKNKADSATNCNPGDIALRETTYMEQGSCLKNAVNSCIQMEEEVPPCGTGVTKRIVGHLDVMEHSDHASEIAKLDPVGRSSEICVGLHSVNKVERKRKRKRKRSKKTKADSVTNCNPGYFALCETPNMRRGSSLKEAVDSCIQVDGEVPSCGTEGSLSLEKQLGDIKSSNLDRKQGDKRVLGHLDVVEHSNHASEIAKLDPVGRSSEICVVLHSINKVERKGKRKRKRSKKNKADGSTNCKTTNMQQGSSLKDAVDSCMQMDEEVPFCGTGVSLSLEKKLGDIKSLNLDRKQGDKRILVYLDAMDHSNDASEITKLDPVGRSSEICAGLPSINKKDIAEVSVRSRRKRNRIHHRRGKGSNSSLCSLPSTGEVMATCSSVPFLGTNFVGGASSSFVNAELKSGFSENINKVAGYGYSLNEVMVIDLPSKHLGWANGVATSLRHGGALVASVKDDHSKRISESSSVLQCLSNPATQCSRRKLLILDLNGLLADIVPYCSDRYTPSKTISSKAVFKRPFCDDFLQFCFERFDVGIWSSRTRKNVAALVDFLLGATKQKLLFCWDQSHCTKTGYSTMENKDKPLFLKELKKIWNKQGPDLRWVKGQYDESNTLLLDDTPYKALRNPPYTAIFPRPFVYKNVKDTSLGPGGDLRVYLERLAAAENVQVFVKENPFGQKPITRSNISWNFYAKIIRAELSEPKGKCRPKGKRRPKGKCRPKGKRRPKGKHKRASAS